jgi:hypothetical protein
MECVGDLGCSSDQIQAFLAGIQILETFTWILSVMLSADLKKKLISHQSHITICYIT